MHGPTAPCLLLFALAWALAAALARAEPAVIDDSLAQRLVACTICHGREGRAGPDGYYPRIAGKPADYLFNQLMNFQQGRRMYGPMVRMVAPLSPAYLREIAEHFAALDPPYPAPLPSPASAADLARGRQLASQGDPAKDLPPCSACHGDALTGALPATPGLLGLPRDYLVGQLGAWVNGGRHAQAPDCMAQIARRLTGGDVYAVSQWLASQPVPSDAKPVARPSVAPPLRCGRAAGSTP